MSGKPTAKGRVDEPLTADELALLQRLRSLKTGLHRVMVYKRGQTLVWCAVMEDMAKIERLAPE